MTHLNLHHLRYFWRVAHRGNLTEAAREMNVSQSALSVQLKKLEDALGHPLFERRGRSLVLTEAGRIALDYADTIFSAGEELVKTLSGRAGPDRRPLRVGAITTLSRNFQVAFLRPVIGRPDVELTVRSGTLPELLALLDAHEIDIVLTNRDVTREGARPVHGHLIEAQPVGIVGRPEDGVAPLAFPHDLDGVPVVLPARSSEVRLAFDRVTELAGVRPQVLAEVDDMAMLRLLARETPGALALVPPVVVQDELASGRLSERCRIPDIVERFFALTQSRRFPNPLVAELIAAAVPADAPQGEEA